MPTTLTPASGVTDPLAGSEYRDIKNRNEFIPHRADLEEAAYPEMIIRLYESGNEAAPADIKTLSDGNRARFLATSAYQQWKAQPQTPQQRPPVTPLTISPLRASCGGDRTTVTATTSLNGLLIGLIFGGAAALHLAR